MNFDLTEEQVMLQETVGQYLKNELPAPRLREVFDGPTGHDPALWKGMLEMGLAGLAIAEEYGGAGLEILDLAVVAEVLGYHAVPGPFLGHALAGLAIGRAGSATQREQWLPKLASGEVTATVALAEQGAGWQPDQWSLVAGDALCGSKQLVPFAELADLIVVGLAGGKLGLVERGASGVEIGLVDAADLTRRLNDVTFSDAPCSVLDGDAAAARHVRDVGLVLAAADAFGGGQRCVDMSVEYAKTREQFGVVIGQFQALKHQLANMALAMEPCRGLYWYAAHAIDHAPEEAERTAAIAKAHITDRFMQVARDAVEVHGGIGFTWECDVQIWFKRAMFDRAFLGNPAFHRERSVELAGW